MKTAKNDPDILPEYDFSNSKPSAYAQRYASGTNVVFLDPDVAECFPSSARVNEALRLLIKANRLTLPVEDKIEEPADTDKSHPGTRAEIRSKRGDTRISTIRKNYPGFAPDVRGNMKLETFLDREGFASLSEALEDRERKSGGRKR